jgi:hypothetical protein
MHQNFSAVSYVKSTNINSDRRNVFGFQTSVGNNFFLLRPKEITTGRINIGQFNTNFDASGSAGVIVPTNEGVWHLRNSTSSYHAVFQNTTVYSSSITPIAAGLPTNFLFLAVNNSTNSIDVPLQHYTLGYGSVLLLSKALTDSENDIFNDIWTTYRTKIGL